MVVYHLKVRWIVKPRLLALWLVEIAVIVNYGVSLAVYFRVTERVMPLVHFCRRVLRARLRPSLCLLVCLINGKIN